MSVRKAENGRRLARTFEVTFLSGDEATVLRVASMCV
jgi:hypothetical protein